MVHCCVTGCSNKQDGTRSFFLIPSAAKKKKIRRQWLVNIGRVEHRGQKTGVGKLWSPTKAHVCSDHFTPEAYVRDPRLLASLGFSDFKGLRLKDDAVPTVFPERPSTSAPKMERPRGAIEKLVKQRIFQDALKENQQETSQLNLPQINCNRSRGQDSLLKLDHSYHTYNATCADHDQYPALQYKSVAVQTTKERVFSKCSQTERPTYCTVGTQTDHVYAGVETVETASWIHPELKECSIQCSILSTPPMMDDNEDDFYKEAEEDRDDDDYDEDDVDWEPADDSDSDVASDDGEIDEIDITDVEKKPEEEEKFIVFQSAITELLKVCKTCSGDCRVYLKRQIGSCVTFCGKCVNGHEHLWTTQPIHNRLPLGNLLIAGAILFSGSSAGQVLKMFNNAKITTFTERTYRQIQANYLIPSVNNIWLSKRQDLVQDCAGRNLKLGGDGRCCSPGHTPKYGSYSLMDLETGLILDMQLVQVTEVKNSYVMELEGLCRGLQALRDCNLKISDLTTDRHVQVRKYLANEQPDIRHWFDVWHMAKGIDKKILAIANKKGCEQLHSWSHSISNHMYWAAASSGGDEQLVTEKWTSITNHVCNIHNNHGERYRACNHGVLAKDWILKGSKVYKMLIEIVCNERLLKDIKKLSPAEQTSSLEAYHKLVCQFAPKFQHFFYGSMKARLLLAVLHNNENVGRSQATKLDGTKRWKISYPKAKKGKHTVKALKDDCTYGYVQDLLKESVDLRYQYQTYREAKRAMAVEYPPPTTSRIEKVDVLNAVQEHRTRFNKIH